MQQSSTVIHILIVFDGNIILMFQVRASVIQMLPSAEISDLPVVVKFILQSVGDNDAFEVWYTNSCAVNLLRNFCSVTENFAVFVLLHFVLALPQRNPHREKSGFKKNTVKNVATFSSFSDSSFA